MITGTPCYFYNRKNFDIAMLRSVRDEIVEVVNKLFVFTDNQNWDELRTEVFTNQVEFDMSSLGGVKATLTSAEICEISTTLNFALTMCVIGT